MTQAVDHLTSDRVKDTDGAVITTTHHPRSSQGRSDLQAYIETNGMFESLGESKRTQRVGINPVLQIVYQDRSAVV
jgi:hypothetical protein